MSRVLLVVVVLCLNACGGGPEKDVISVSITLANLPESISYNKASTPDRRVEYSWAIIFDTSGDGAINQGDLELSVIQFKRPDAIEVVGEISDFVAKLSLYTTDTSNISVATADLQLTANTMVLSIDVSAHESLKNITPSTLVNFFSSAYDLNVGRSEYDYFPSQGALVDIPVIGGFVDTHGDAEFDFIDMVSMSVEL